MITEDQAIGLYVGLFIGDALGAPLEFMKPTQIKTKHTEMTGGGVHDTAAGEWTDDGAMAQAIAAAYVKNKRFDPEAIASNLMLWRSTGAFGTRDYVFDSGLTCSEAIHSMTPEQPYMGSTDYMSSGNGSIMRLAPIMVANHEMIPMAVAQGIAVSLMTHGNADIINHTTAFIHQCMAGQRFDAYRKFNRFNLRETADITGRRTVNHIAHAHVQAWSSVNHTRCFESAVIHAVNKGYDADTVGAVTGMLAGRIYGYSSFPPRWLSVLHQHEHLVETAKELYAMGTTVKTPVELQ